MPAQMLAVTHSQWTTLGYALFVAIVADVVVAIGVSVVKNRRTVLKGVRERSGTILIVQFVLLIVLAVAFVIALSQRGSAKKSTPPIPCCLPSTTTTSTTSTTSTTAATTAAPELLAARALGIQQKPLQHPEFISHKGSQIALKLASLALVSLK